MTTWHQEFFAAVGKWPWLTELNESVSDVVQPVYDRYRGNLAVELLHGGRWAGHALHPALSDLPDRLLVRLAAARHGRQRRHRHQGQAGRGGHAQRGGPRGGGGHGRHRRGGLDGERRRGPAGRALPRPAQRRRHRRCRARRWPPGCPATAARPARSGMASMAVTTAAGFVGGHLVQGRGAMVNRVASQHRARRAGSRPSPSTTCPTASPRASTSRAARCCSTASGETVYAHRRRLQPRGRPAVAAGRSSTAWSPARCTSRSSTCATATSSAGPAHHPQPALPSRVRNGWIEVRGSQPGRRRAKT